MTAAGWFALRGLTLALAWFCLLNVAAGVVVALLAGPLAAGAATANGLRCGSACASLRRSRRWPSLPGSSCRRTGCYEPRDVIEGFDVLLTAGALVTCLAIGAGVMRGVSAWQAPPGGRAPGCDALARCRFRARTSRPSRSMPRRRCWRWSACSVRGCSSPVG